MKWAEVIMLRSADSKSKMLATTLQSLMNDVVKNAGHASIRVFRREKLDADICIVLFHRREKTQTGGSPLGLHLVAALKAFGLVNHTIWGEMER
jgi:hypothetical protein